MTRPRARTAWLAAAGITILAAAVAVLAILRGGFSDTDGKILATLGLCLYCGGTALAGLAVVERGARIGWLVVAAAAAGFFVVVPSVWRLFDESGDGGWSIAWLGLLATLAALVSSTAWLAARGRTSCRLALLTGVLAVCAAAASFAAIHADDTGDATAKTVAVLWTLTVLFYVLTPVVGRLGETTAPTTERRPPEAGSPPRVIASLDDVELVVTSAGSGVDLRLAPGERVELRRRSADADPDT